MCILHDSRLNETSHTDKPRTPKQFLNFTCFSNRLIKISNFKFQISHHSNERIYFIYDPTLLFATHLFPSFEFYHQPFKFGPQTIITNIHVLIRRFAPNLCQPNRPHSYHNLNVVTKLNRNERSPNSLFPSIKTKTYFTRANSLVTNRRYYKSLYPIAPFLTTKFVSRLYLITFIMGTFKKKMNYAKIIEKTNVISNWLHEKF